MADLQVYPDMFMRREVKLFVVHFTFMNNGCSWKGAVRKLEVSTLTTKNEVNKSDMVVACQVALEHQMPLLSKLIVLVSSL